MSHLFLVLSQVWLSLLNVQVEIQFKLHLSDLLSKPPNLVAIYFKSYYLIF